MTDKIDPRYISPAMATDTELGNHTGNLNNPHSTTKAQVGLGNVQDVDTTSTTNINEGTKLFFTTARVLATALTGLSLVTGTAIISTDTVLVAMGKLQKQITDVLTSLNSHTANVSNPHSTTKAQVGLGNVQDVDTTSTTNITEGTKLFFTTARVLATALTGLSILTGTDIVATDTILVAIGKAQAQINALRVSVTPSSSGSVNSAGVSSAAAKADHTHNIALVSNTLSVVETEITSTSATDVLLTGMTITPIAGTYKVYVITTSNNSGNNTNFFSIYKGGVQVANTEKPVARISNTFALVRLGYEMICEVTVNGSEAIEIRWRRNAGTASCYSRELSILRVG